ARTRARGAEPDLALLLVDLLDAADGPLPLRDLVLHRAARAVIQIKMVPAVALGHPDDFPAVRDVVAELLAGAPVAARLVVVEERLRFLGDHGARLTGHGIRFDHSIDLVPALVVLERQRAAVLAPEEPREAVGVR